MRYWIVSFRVCWSILWRYLGNKEETREIGRAQLLLSGSLNMC